MSNNIDVGDEVVFRQQAPDGWASNNEHDILIEDHTAYMVHYGKVVGDDVKGDHLEVEWHDGEVTNTQIEKLVLPENAEWLPE